MMIAVLACRLHQPGLSLPLYTNYESILRETYIYPAGKLLYPRRPSQAGG